MQRSPVTLRLTVALLAIGLGVLAWGVVSTILDPGEAPPGLESGKTAPAPVSGPTAGPEIPAPARGTGARAPEPGPVPAAERSDVVEVGFRARILGRLLDPAGRPLAGVEVRLTAPMRSGLEAALLFGDASRTSVRIAATARSGPNGSFVLEGADPEKVYFLEVGQAPYAPYSRKLSILAFPEATDLGDIQLLAGGVVSGLCVDPIGRPVQNVWIRVKKIGPRGRLQWNQLIPREGDRFFTDAQGRFRIEGTPVGQVGIEAGKSGCITARTGPLAVAAEQEVKDIRLVLEAGKTISGQVVDPLGKGIHGIRVYANPPPGQGDRAKRSGTHGMAISNPEGRFAIEGLRPGKYRVSALSFGRRVQGQEAVAGQSNLRIRFGAVNVLKIQGKVVMKGDGTPLEGVDIRLVSPETADAPPEGAPRTRTDAAGQFSLEADRAWGMGVVVARLEGFAPASSAAFPLVPTGPAPGEILLHLDRGGILSGRVKTRARAEALEGAWVFLRREAGAAGTGSGLLRYLTPTPGGRRSLARIRTDAGGRFRFSGIPAGTYALEVRYPGYADARLEGIEVTPGSHRSDLEVALGRGGSFTGTVFYRDGGRTEGATVILTRTGKKEKETSRLTNAEGVARFERLAVGEYQVTVVGPGGKRRGPWARGLKPRNPAKLIHVAEGQAVVRTFTVERGVRVEGVVLEAGIPYPDCLVSFRPHKPVRPRVATGVLNPLDLVDRIRETRTDAEGRYDLDHVQPGQYQASLRIKDEWSSYVAVTRRVEVPRTFSLTVNLDVPSGSLSGRIALPDGMNEGSPRPRLRLTRTAGGDRYVRTLLADARGRYVFRHLQPGTYEVLVFKSEHWAAMSRTHIVVGRGAHVTRVDFQLLAGVTVRGQVVDEKSRPVSRASVRAVPEEDEARRLNPFGHGRTGPDGRFTLSNLLPGRYAFRAHKLRRYSEPVKVVVTQRGQQPFVRLELTMGVRK